MSVAQENFSYLQQQEVQQVQRKAAPRLSQRAVRRGKLLLTGCILALFMMGVTVAYYFAQLSSVGYQISQLQSQLAALETEQEYLETQANQLMSLQRIEAIATTKLGMVKPDPQEVVLVAALPTVPDEGSPKSTSEKVSQGTEDNVAKAKDRHGETNSSSPVIEAFVGLVNRWGKS
ncbi:cell division protein FtsL [Desulforamulus ferrireducens]|uniref:Cell division protein FtsL n=1 Tax=Desulforamulus ferrireducens TaxID=1833852 RepID=A0A1S6IU23_9FIRM|nr:cell division protein FtsL [Desulforamulus ferrireducens]AQS58280.1 cell division protein FtsL [Desulforamulus ferrireducens]